MRSLTEMLGRGLSSWMSARGLHKPPATEGTLPANTIVHAQKMDTAGLFRRPGLKFLHVGCGPARKPQVGPGLLGEDWQEIRLDIDEAAEPDVLCSMLDMAPVPSASVDAVYSSHNIEHLYPHEVPAALAEFLRVLKPDGILVVTCPDLQAVCRLVAEDKLTEPAYVVPIGPVAPLDILYGYRPELASGNLYMAHRTGFTLRSLVDTLRSAGFRSVAGRAHNMTLALWVVASKALLPEDEISRLADTHLPL